MNKTQNFWLWGGLGIALLGIFYLLSGILLPFLTGLLVAYAMNPAVRKFENWGIDRSVGTLLMLSTFFLVITLVLLIVIPFLQREFLYLITRLPHYGTHLMGVLQPFLEKTTAYIQPSDVAHFRDLLTTHLGDLITWGLRLLLRILTNSLAIANLLSLIVITPIVAFYCLRDWEKMITTLDRWLPRPYEPSLRKLFGEINRTLGAFVKGQSLVCVMVGLYYCVALTLADLDFSLTVGIIIGLAAFIPYLGALLGFVLSLAIALAQFSEWGPIGIIVAIFFVGQTLEGYLFIPYFIGDRIGLHPVWVIFALLAGGMLYGFLGILFALPLAATLGVFLRYLLQIYLKSPYYLGKVSSSHKKVS